MNYATQDRSSMWVIVARKATAVLALSTFVLVIWCTPVRAETSVGKPSRQVLKGHLRQEVISGKAARVGLLPPTQRLNLVMMLPLRNQRELAKLLTGIYDPSSPDYRHFLSTAQFTERFGPAEKDYQAVVDFAKANGFTVTDFPANRLILDINGSVAQIESTLQVKMTVYRHPTEPRTFYSPDREPTLDLRIPVSHIAGLNNFSVPRPMMAKSAVGDSVYGNVTGSGPGGAYLGSDMRAAYYGGTTLTGSGQSVGLFEFDGYNLSDVNLTFNNAGQAYTVPINNVLLDGATGTPSGDDAEQVLDIVQAISMAPGLSQVRVYIAPFNGSGTSDVDILNSMAAENLAKQLSCSWLWSPEDPSSDDPIFEEYAAQGQSFFVASGDYGAYLPPEAAPFYYPAEDAFVTAVGGTHLSTTGPGGRWEAETSWNDSPFDLYASGGGISPDSVPIPSWQFGAVNASNSASTTLRNIPDVAMEADTDNYLCHLGICGGGWGGTSFAAPRWAGFLALVNEEATAAGESPVGFVNPAFYSVGLSSGYSNDFHDITTGNNDITAGVSGGYNAVSGYDLVTGWGSPNGQSLIDALPAAGFALASSPASLTVIQGGPGGSTAITLNSVNGFSGSVSLAASGLPPGVTASFSPTTISGNGTSTLSLTASNSVTVGNATILVTATFGNQSATTSVALSVNFAFGISAPSASVVAGDSVNSTITMAMQPGFAGTVGMGISGLPAGATGVFTPASLNASGTSTLALSTTSNTQPGTYPLVVTGSSGSLTQTINLTLVVDAVATSFVIGASPGSVTIAQAAGNNMGSTIVTVTSENSFSAPITLNATSLPAGVMATFSLNPVAPIANGSVTSTMTLFEIGWPAPYGTFPIVVSGNSGYQVAATNVSLTVNPLLFTFGGGFASATLAQGTSGTTSVFASGAADFSSPVSLSTSGLPDGVTAVFSPNPLIPVFGYGSSTLTLSASATAPTGTFPITLEAACGTFSASLPEQLTVTSSGVSIAAVPASFNLTQNENLTGTITITSLNGFGSPIYFDGVNGLPDGIAWQFNPSSITPPPNGSSTTILTLVASANATTGTFPINVISSTSGGGLFTSTPMSLTVGEAGEPTYVTLSSAFNRAGIFADGLGDSNSSGLDMQGHVYSANLLRSLQTWNGTPFLIDTTSFSFDVVSGLGQTISLPAGSFTALRLLATGVNGNQPSQAFTIVYADGTATTITQSLSDWHSPQGYLGESQAAVMPYLDVVSTGGRMLTTTYVYGYSFPLDPTRIVASVILPNDENVEVLAMTLLPVPTTTTITSSANPSIYEQPVTFTAGVTSAIGAPPDGAIITFMNNQATLGTATLGGGSAVLSTAALPIGTSSITARFAGVLAFVSSTSPVLNQLVSHVPTTTMLSSSLNPSVHGQAVTFTAAVVSVEGLPPDGESLTFMNGAAALATARISGGTASFITSTLPVGTNLISAVYQGDGIFGSSTSNVVSQVVNKNTAVKTTTVMSLSPNPSVYGQTVLFTAVTTSAIGPPPDGETVAFMKGRTLLGTGSLTGGATRFLDSTLTVGTTSVTAVYGGDINFLGSTSKAVSQAVGKATTTMTLTSSQNPSKAGQLVTFTAVVIPEFSGTPTGKVSFYDGTTLLKTVTLNGGLASLKTGLTKGTHNVKATYSGSTNFTTSSYSLTQTVN